MANTTNNDNGQIQFEVDGPWYGDTTTKISIPRSQVYLATHDGADNRLPYRSRSFISFSYGGKWIEDFNLIATLSGDMMERPLVSEFDDLTTTYDVLEGLFYHGTHYRTNSITFHLSTDGIDEKKLEQFKAWFAPGNVRELILSEHPNRAIMARVSSPPEMEMLPFEKEITMTMAGLEYTTSTTNYKGTITLEMIMDEPFWYSIINIFGSVSVSPGNNITYVNSWDGVNFLTSTPEAQDKLKDVLKIVYEDGIPLYSMINASSMIFGNGTYAVSGGRLVSKVIEIITLEEYTRNMHIDGYYMDGDTDKPKFPNSSSNTKYYTGAIIYDPETGKGGVIDGSYVTTTSATPLTIASTTENAAYLYYAGTAPGPIELKFTVDIDLNEGGYVISPWNSFAGKTKNYNTITFESINKYRLRMTTPNFLTSYNKAYKILAAGKRNNLTFELLREDIRDNIRHPIIRTEAIKVINFVETLYPSTVAIGDSPNLNKIKYDLIETFASLFTPLSLGTLPTLAVTLNSKTGEALGTYTYYSIDSLSGTIRNIEIQLKITQFTENIGDAFDTNYLILKEKNTFASGYKIQLWDSSNKDWSYRIYHNFDSPLSNVSVEFKNMYF